MFHAPHTVLRASLLALALLAAGCPEKKETPAPSPGSGASGGFPERSTPLRAGVKVPLPQGWSALVAADSSFQAGPPDHPVLRVDFRRGEGDHLPSVEALTRSIREQFSEFQVSLDQEEGDENVTLVRITLAPKLTDGGLGPHGPALIGARRVGEDLFLCATLPGATGEEVRLATEACRDIQVQAAPR
ncbi:hypothetical protein [Hyalangium minutum]|uniref:Putative lipoprotein n=1 Tax=Hyalangium minutum TaxID=394096 RepID=A0A085WLM1_9BACT|nr:hypothetical protein [Hyalangium minutum]KFE68584.1 putative lipoprotein [Hyalangium minutum]